MTIISVGLVGTCSASVVWLTLGTLCALVGITTVRRPSGPSPCRADREILTFHKWNLASQRLRK